MVVLIVNDMDVGRDAGDSKRMGNVALYLWIWGRESSCMMADGSACLHLSTYQDRASHTKRDDMLGNLVQSLQHLTYVRVGLMISILVKHTQAHTRHDSSAFAYTGRGSSAVLLLANRA